MSKLLYSDKVLVRILVLTGKLVCDMRAQSKDKPLYIDLVSQSRPPYCTEIQSNNGSVLPRVADEVENQVSFQIYLAIAEGAVCIHNVSVC